jgi:hypothetical protein
MPAAVICNKGAGSRFTSMTARYCDVLYVELSALSSVHAKCRDHFINTIVALLAADFILSIWSRTEEINVVVGAKALHFRPRLAFARSGDDAILLSRAAAVFTTSAPRHMGLVEEIPAKRRPPWSQSQ